MTQEVPVIKTPSLYILVPLGACSVNDPSMAAECQVFERGDSSLSQDPVFGEGRLDLVGRSWTKVDTLPVKKPNPFTLVKN